MWKTIASGQTWSGEICNKTKNGDLYWVQSTIAPFLDEKTQKPEHYVAIRTEFTHQKELQEKLDRLFLEAMVANEAKSSFLTNMSHELRTPLNHIIGFSELIEISTNNPDLLENVEYIKKSSFDLLYKINNILEIVNTTDQYRETPEVIDIVSLVNSEFIEKFCSLAHKSKRKFTATIPDKEIYIVADCMELLSAFDKIAENAVQFSDEGDIVGISISDNDGTVQLQSLVLGRSLPQKILSSKIEPFTIGEQVMTKRVSGMGLGLSIAKKLCTQNGGKLEIEVNEDIGTKIHFRFPIVQ